MSEWNPGWIDAKKGESILKNNWQNHENEKPLTVLLKEKNVNPTNFFNRSPKKW